ALLSDGADQIEAFASGSGRKERNFHVDASGALQIDFDEIRAAGGEHPDDAAAVGATAHFLSEHGVDAAADTGIAAGGIAATESLVGFVDEDVATAEGVNKAEDFFEISLAAAHPFVAEVFHLHDRDARFAGKAFDQEGFAGA